MDIKQIQEKIENAGGNIYLVGGAVRDKLMNKEVHDEDYCITGITAEQFMELFPTAHIRGKSFEVFDIDRKEFALARVEQKNGIGHKQFDVTTGKDIKIEQDLERRDLTINSMAQNLKTGEIIDPFGGKQDLENRIIRATSNKFSEDPLRVYRTARFAATLGFEVEKSTLEMMNSLKQELSSLSAERVFDEFRKALLANRPSIFFNVLREADMLEVHFKEVFDLIGAIQPKEYHPEGDAYNHTMLVLDKAAELSPNVQIRFASLVHDFGKGVTPKEEYPHHYEHEKNGVKLVQNFGNRLKMPNSWIKCGKTACLEHMRGGIFYKMTARKKVDFIERVGKSILGLDGLQIVVYADRTGRKDSKQDLEQITFAEVGKKCLKEITGDMIANKYNLTDGRKIGSKLHEERIKFINTIDKV